MAVIQDEQGNNKPIVTDTSHVFDVNGNPLHGQLFLGEVVAENGVEPIDGYAHESEVNAISQNLTELQKNNLGSAVDISSYTTTANLYTCPTDGYVVMDTSSSASAWVNMEIYSATTNVSFIVSTNNSRNAVFVKKGMRLRRAGGSGTSNVSFYSLQ